VFVPLGIGFGVTIYVIDTGVRITHDELDGRASYAPLGRDGDLFGDPFGLAHGADDCHGHGTHMAGLAAGYRFGLAPGAEVLAVRVTDCHGRVKPEVAVRAIDWIATHAVRPAVVLMSLAYGNEPSVRAAVERLVHAGIPFVTGAGNLDKDACDTSPAGAPSAIVAAGAKRDDKPVTFGNFGPCVDIFAPGEAVLSADNASDTALKLRGGSSTAAALAAGAAALILERFPFATPCDVESFLVESATLDTVSLA
jgi:subtilisin family serine protease